MILRLLPPKYQNVKFHFLSELLDDAIIERSEIFRDELDLIYSTFWTHSHLHVHWTLPSTCL